MPHSAAFVSALHKLAACSTTYTDIKLFAVFNLVLYIWKSLTCIINQTSSAIIENYIEIFMQR